MRRPLVGVLVLVLLVGAEGVAAPSARANTGACVGQGNLITPPLGLAGLSSNSGSFFMNLPLANCVFGGPFSATGTLSGSCQAASGTGVTSDGVPFSLVIDGGLATLTGRAEGAFAIAENPLDSGSCLNASATHFLLAGAVRRRDPCTFESTTTVPAPWGPLTIYICV